LTDEQISALKEPGGKTRPGLFTPEEQAVLRYTDLLTTRAENVEAADLEALSAHFSEEQIIELALAIATANWTTRINDGLQVPWTDTGADD
jgi:alkylhydroperoxidase family enzyme